MTIDWNAIRPLNGSRQNGFEELCAQLADAESPSGSLFIRKGTPDAGVECFAVLADGNEWGWQAKYFDGLGSSQWGQLDESVKTALVKHPRLVRYFICIPLDRPDARIPRRRSAMEQWNAHVQKWNRWATKRGMTVEFVYWGSHELLSRLTRPQHVGRLRFFFDLRGFDEDWFAARLEEAVKTAGPRYTPEIHVDLPIAGEFEAFGRTPCFFDSLKAHARCVREKLRHLSYSESKNGDDSPDIASGISTIRSLTDLVLSDLSSIKVQPVGELPFHAIVDNVTNIKRAAAELEKTLLAAEKEHDAKIESGQEEGTKRSSFYRNPFRDRINRLFALRRELQDLAEALNHAQKLATSNLILLSGGAGTGKTHLLCDVANKRLREGRPTVLLMGQRFISTDDPWSQALQQLDLGSFSAEEFVGALEAAAQAAECRVLVIIDALNEGAGRHIWPDHLAAFITHLHRSQWVGVALAVRSSYENLIVPDEVRRGAVEITHHGFADHEYDATKTFFTHYGLELPSTPLLAPEFRNPLFLKTLCSGLSARGDRRMPRGFHGITSTFDLFLTVINSRLALELSYNPKSPLVSRALDAFAKALVEAGERWLPLSKAEETVNAVLPGREFERSLYRGLAAEGILVEEALHRKAGPEEVVYLSYERLADHLVAKSLLDAHLDLRDPDTAFASGAPLGFLGKPEEYVSPGLLEAFCVQIPERTGKEITEVAPAVEGRWGLGDAFRQSIIWRSLQSFCESTREILNKLVRSDHDWSDTHDVIVTVATLPQHPFNALFLDQTLRRFAMPERDAWWSIFLHHTWRSHGAVDRLVDWAFTVKPEDTLDEETVDLCSTTLAWMLTTSNRYLRDRATKALVTLMTGRLRAVARLVEKFADVDDPYVLERIYAVAYGTAMRSHSPADVGALAECVYGRVFSPGPPPVHILLRDYARGVIERALYLGAPIEVVPEHIRPPYNSTWPAIPTEDEIKPFLADWSRGSHDSGDLEWARNRIGSSVMDDGFARYVIATNSGPFSSGWLAVPLSEPRWKSPDERLYELVSDFSEQELLVWEEFKAAEDGLKRMRVEMLLRSIQKTADVEGTGPTPDHDSEQMAQKRADALAKLETVLTEEHTHLLKEILHESNADGRQVPRFDLRQIQRYILWRVFDLGWTTERFGKFDRFEIGHHGREAPKAERIGKKYQWIAYHEIMALVADNFQYRHEFGEYAGSREYEGPWQVSVRNIDPSCTLRAAPEEKSGESRAWWKPHEYNSWDVPQDHLEWVRLYDDVPRIENLLRVVCPRDSSHWINLHGHFTWSQPTPADRESTEVERREIWLMCTGYLVRAEDAPAFMAWAEGADFWGRWMPEPPENYTMFLGEYGWSPASRYYQQEYFGGEVWTQPGHGCPVELQNAVMEYLAEGSGFDSSIDDGFKLRLPCATLVDGLGLQWGGRGTDFVDRDARRMAFDPTAYEDGPSALLLQQEELIAFLRRVGLAFCWTVLGEKRVLGAGFDPKYYSALRMTGAYLLREEGPEGFLKCQLENRTEAGGGVSHTPFATIRTG